MNNKLCVTVIMYKQWLLVFCFSFFFTTGWAIAYQAEGNASLKEGRFSSLKEAYADKFLIGAALSDELLANKNHPSFLLVKKHFSSITSTDALKWETFNPKPEKYNTEPVDYFVEVGVKNGLDIVGHVLFWHSQTPDWVFEDETGKPLTRDALLTRMRARVKTLAARYGDKIKSWDVVNEAFEANGTLRNTKFTQIIGSDFIEQAFKIAAEELPKNVKLIYNDYDMFEAGRRNAVAKMVKDFRSKGVRIDGVGIQGHWELQYPRLWRAELALQIFSSLKIPVYITEMDLDYLGRRWFFGASQKTINEMSSSPKSNPYANDAIPLSVDQALADRYVAIFSLYLKYSDIIERVTFWGVTDADSWLNDWPVDGRTNYPLLFTRSGASKLALERLIALTR